MGTKMSSLDWIAGILLIVGGLNWGLIAVADFDLVAALFGKMSMLSRIVYGLVGLSAVWAIGMLSKKGKGAGMPSKPAGGPGTGMNA